MFKSKKLNVLLVEDDNIDLMTIQRGYTGNDMSNHLYVAHDGFTALAMLRGDITIPSTIPLDRRLVLLDLNLPKLHGLDFLKELRSDPKIRSTPVIILTSSTRKKDVVEAYHLNVSGYMKKPNNLKDFIETLSIINHYWSSCETIY